MKSVSEYSFGNPERLFACAPNLTSLCLVTERKLSVVEERKNGEKIGLSFDDIIVVFCLEIPKSIQIPRAIS